MTAKEYLLGLTAIISGLAIADMVVSLHHLLMASRRVRWDWLALTAATYAFYVLVFSWWVGWRSFDDPDINNLTLGTFFLVLAQLVLMYLAARAALPDSVPDEGLDLKEHYARVSRYVWSAVSLLQGLVLSLSAFEAVIDGTPGLANFWPLLVSLALVLPLVIVRRRVLHMILVPLITVILIATTLNLPLTPA
ncbi:hypothetical protein [uncultured Brevundimonas sp.]|uniref:hypothetical protein n=1 Tax=uncultured Brevundimonas sp. TaxID=213418 RepID=UPI0026067436|nr:hypothetical protein [uncultured Brevundimonas sp.]